MPLTALRSRQDTTRLSHLMTHSCTPFTEPSPAFPGDRARQEKWAGLRRAIRTRSFKSRCIFVQRHKECCVGPNNSCISRAEIISGFQNKAQALQSVYIIDLATPPLCSHPTLHSPLAEAQPRCRATSQAFAPSHPMSLPCSSAWHLRGALMQ